MPQSTTKLIHSENLQEGLLLCMLVVASIDETPHPEETREIAMIAADEPEFSSLNAEKLDQLFAKVQKDIHKKPEEIFLTIKRLLNDDKSRERGLALAVRVVIADGIVNEDHVAFLERLQKAFGLTRDKLDDIIIAAQKHLVRFMMVYLVYLTILSDNKISPKEFEFMIPLVLSLPVFKGVTSEQFAYMSQSVRRHLDLMKKDWGLDYITGTIRKAAELLADESIPEQACKLVARGIFADGKVGDGEREFFENVCNKLGLPSSRSSELIQKTTIRSSEKK